MRLSTLHNLGGNSPCTFPRLLSSAAVPLPPPQTPAPENQLRLHSRLNETAAVPALHTTQPSGTASSILRACPAPSSGADTDGTADLTEGEETGLTEEEQQNDGETRRNGERPRNPFLQQEGLPKFESFTPEASKEVCLVYRKGHKCFSLGCQRQRYLPRVTRQACKAIKSRPVLA